jgi:hypothetical protein
MLYSETSGTEYTLTRFTYWKKGVLTHTTVQGSRLAFGAQILIPKATEKQQLVKPISKYIMQLELSIVLQSSHF